MPRNPIQHTCLFCNTQFFSYKLHSKYCCGKHSRDARSAASKLKAKSTRIRVKIEKVCIICGNNFKTRHKSTVTCSRKCAGVMRSQKNEKHALSCAYCGKEITVTSASARKFCDMGCLRAYHKPRHRKCVCCGVVFCPIKFDKKWNRWVPDRQLKTCSRQCSLSMHRGHRSPLWQGGKTVYHRTSTWQVAAEKARSRDKYTCQRCGKKQEDAARKLDVHHINTYYNVNDAKKAHRLSNLITLCQSCHRKTESENKQHHQVILPFEYIAQQDRRAARASAQA